MKVALVIDKFDPAGGGAECWTVQHADRLLADGHEVHLVCRMARQVPPGAVCHAMDDAAASPRGQRLTLPDRAAGFLQGFNVDIIHDMGVGWHADVFMPHSGTRRAIFLQQSKLLLPPERWLRPLGFLCLPRYRRFQALEARQFRDCPGRPGKRFLAVSNMVKNDMIRYHRVPPERIHVVHNGVDTRRFTPGDADARQALRRSLGFSDGTTLYLLVAHDWDLKGLRTLLRALRAMVAAGEDVGLVVVGPGSMRGQKFWGIPLGRPNRRYPQLARRWGCEHAVRFVGHQADPVPYYQAADVYVQPSLYDACSLVVLEAMACGLPVVTSRYNGVSELIESGRQGLIMNDPQDAGDLARCMRHYLSGETRLAAAAAARQLALERSALANYEDVLQIYRQVLAERGSERPTRLAIPPLSVVTTQPAMVEAMK